MPQRCQCVGLCHAQHEPGPGRSTGQACAVWHDSLRALPRRRHQQPDTASAEHRQVHEICLQPQRYHNRLRHLPWRRHHGCELHRYQFHRGDPVLHHAGCDFAHTDNCSLRGLSPRHHAKRIGAGCGGQSNRTGHGLQVAGTNRRHDPRRHQQRLLKLPREGLSVDEHGPVSDHADNQNRRCLLHRLPDSALRHGDDL